MPPRDRRRAPGPRPPAARGHRPPRPRRAVRSACPQVPENCSRPPCRAAPGRRPHRRPTPSTCGGRRACRARDPRRIAWWLPDKHRARGSCPITFSCEITYTIYYRQTTVPGSAACLAARVFAHRAPRGGLRHTRRAAAQDTAQVAERVLEVLGDELSDPRVAPVDPCLEHVVMLAFGAQYAALGFEMLAYIAIREHVQARH